MIFDKKERYYSYTRRDLVDLLPALDLRFLEVGCGAGTTLEYLKSKGALYTAGIDSNKDAIRKATQKGFDRTLLADVEKDVLPFREKEFDCIIFADVLEHLYDPWNVLKKMTLCLDDNGYVLLSIPNIKHYSLLADLIFHDTWTYSDDGILDNSHIRFFTLKEILNLLDYAGLESLKIKSVNDLGRNFIFLKKIVLNRFRSFSVSQYLILAKKRDVRRDAS